MRSHLRPFDSARSMLLPAVLISMFITLIVLVFVVFTASAGPASPLNQVLRQPDGTEFPARFWGDEKSHGFETTEGYTITVDRPAGQWVYARRAVNGTLAPIAGPNGTLVVTNDPPPLGLSRHIRPLYTSRAPDEAPAVTVAEVAEAPPAPPSPSSPPAPPSSKAAGTTSAARISTTGTQRLLVLLVAFSDRPAISEPGEWSSKFFSNTGSVKSYYKEVSYGLLNLAPASENSGVADDGVVGWITLPYGHPNGDKTREIAAIRDAIAAAARNVRFASFDTNGDGFLSSDEIHTVIIFSGFNGSYNTSTPTVWPYQAAYTAGIPVGGKQIGSAAGKGGIVIMAELDGQHTATIGTPVHEIGHDFGLPELYDPDRSTFGVGKWSVMGSGSWNTGGLYPGDTPAHFDAWSKWYLGWVKPTMVTSDAASLSIEQVETSGKIYQLRHNPGGVDWGRHPGNGEYFLIENRQKVGFDAGLPGSGLLIWHINENAPNDRALAEANDQNRLIELEQADGRNNLNRDNSGDAGDPYPGTADSRSLGPSTNPSSMLRSGRSSGVTITNISGSGKIMTLYVGASGRDR